MRLMQLNATYATIFSSTKTMQLTQTKFLDVCVSIFIWYFVVFFCLFGVAVGWQNKYLHSPPIFCLFRNCFTNWTAPRDAPQYVLTRFNERAFYDFFFNASKIHGISLMLYINVPRFPKLFEVSYYFSHICFDMSASLLF